MGFSSRIKMGRTSCVLLQKKGTVKRFEIPSVASVSHNYNSCKSVSMIWEIWPFCSFVLRNNFLVSISKIWNHIAIKLGCYEIYRLDTRKYEKYRLGRLPQRGPLPTSSIFFIFPRSRLYISYHPRLKAIYSIFSCLDTKNLFLFAL